MRILKLAKLVFSFLGQKGNLVPPPRVLKSLLINGVCPFSRSNAYPRSHSQHYTEMTSSSLIELVAFMWMYELNETRAVEGITGLNTTSQWCSLVAWSLPQGGIIASVFIYTQTTDNNMILVVFTLLLYRYQRHYKIYTTNILIIFYIKYIAF